MALYKAMCEFNINLTILLCLHIKITRVRSFFGYFAKKTPQSEPKPIPIHIRNREKNH